MSTPLVQALEKVAACSRGLVVAQHDGSETLEVAWERWRYPSDLLWLAATLGVARPLVTLAACDCAGLALPWLTHSLVFVDALKCIERWAYAQESAQDVIAAVSELEAVKLPAFDLASSRLDSAKRMLHAAAATTWLELPELATAASDAAVQTYRANSFKVGADLVRARIPWSMIEERLRQRA